MKAADCVKLEKDKTFKLKYLKRTSWWKNILFVPPMLILFLGLFGLLYLTQADMLLTYYAIPFVAVFILGTIWLKAVKKHVRLKLLEREDAFKVCVAKDICVKNGFVYFVFTNGEKRHNEHFISQLAESLSLENEETNMQLSKRKTQMLRSEMLDIDYCMRAYPLNKVKQQNLKWAEGSIAPLLFLDTSNVFVIRGKDVFKQ